MRFNLTSFTLNPKYTKIQSTQCLQNTSPTNIQPTSTTRLNKSDLTPIMWHDNFSTQTDLTLSCPTLSYPALPNYTSPYPSLVVPYLYTSALSPVTTTKFKFYSIMSPPKHIPHLALSIVTAYPKSYLSILQPFFVWLTPSPALSKHISTDICVLIPPFEMQS